MYSRFSNVKILRELSSFENTFHWLSNFINIISILTFELGKNLWRSEISIIVSNPWTIVRLRNNWAFVIFIKNTWSISTFTFIVIIWTIGWLIWSRRLFVIIFWFIRRFIVFKWRHGSWFNWFKSRYIMNWLWFIDSCLNMFNCFVISLIITIISILWSLIWFVLLSWWLIPRSLVSWSLILRRLIPTVTFISWWGFVSWSFILILLIFRGLVSWNILLIIWLRWEGWVNLFVTWKVFIHFKVDSIIIWRVLIIGFCLSLVDIIDSSIISVNLAFFSRSIIIQGRVWWRNNIRVSMNCISMNLMTWISSVFLMNRLLLFISLCTFFNLSIFDNIS